MKYLFVPKDTVVFEYESSGDLFYMVISGKVLCKVPFARQVILLSEDEKGLFQEENKDDLMGISEAHDINKQFGLDISVSNVPKRKEALKAAAERDNSIDMSKLPMLKNPYNLEQSKIYTYCQKILTKQKNRIVQRLIK